MFKNDSDYLDQHFLIDSVVIDRFIDICDFQKADIVVEVGPGSGVLTKKIITRVKSLTAIEKDINLKPYLENIKGLNIIYDNVLNVSIPSCDKIVTALPYSIIEPFIHKLIKTDVKEIYMIMGSTFVDNVISNKINNLSLLTNTFFEATRFFDISPDSFNPKPRTNSSVIKLVKKEKFSKLESFFKKMYELDDKKVKNALIEALIYVNEITQREAKSIISSMNISENLLNKTFNVISNDELKDLYNEIKKGL